MTSNVHPYPSPLFKAIINALQAGALLIEREGFAQVNHGDMVILTARRQPNAIWEVVLGGTE